MSRRFALIFLMLIFAVARFAPAQADDAPQSGAIPAPSETNSEQLLVLRNGEVLRGRVTLEGEHYQLLLADGELRVRTADVELVCKNLDEAYQIRRGRLLPNRADDHLDLAEWCLRQGLPGDAARELSAAMTLDSRNPRIALIDRRLQQSLIPPPTTPHQAPGAAPRVTDEDLDRMVRALPPAAVETFSTVVQPLLISSCATSGCHGPGGKSSFTLARIPADRFANRRLTQRNLQNTLQWLDFPNPPQSRLLTATVQAHGTATTAIFDLQTSKYRQLVAWVGLVTQRPLEVPAPATQAATVRLPGMGPQGNALGSSGQFPPIAAADRDTRPIRAPHAGRPPLVLNVHPDGSSPSLESAMPSALAVGAAGNSAGRSVAGADSQSQAGPAITDQDSNGVEAFNRRFALPAGSEKPAAATKQSAASKLPPNPRPLSTEKSSSVDPSPAIKNPNLPLLVDPGGH